MWYHLDPDYRRNAPATGAYCERCQRAVEPATATRITQIDHYVKIDPEGKGFIGPDCLKKILKNPAPEYKEKP